MKYHILVAVLALAGVSSAYAIEATVDVPFDSWIDTNCALQDDGNFMCIWVPGADTVITPPEIITDEEVVDEVVEVIPEDVIVEPVVQMTREEKEIQRVIARITSDIEERPDAVPHADRQLLELLLRAQDKCEFGIEEGQPIQTYQLFAIPEGYFYPEDTDFAKYNMLGKITQLVEACTNWTDYKAKWLGPEYKNLADADKEKVLIELQRIVDRELFAATAMVNVTKTDEYMNKFISAHDILEEAEDAQTYKCSVLGKQRGFCPEGIGTDEYVHDTSDNPVLMKYQQYQNDPENAVGDPKYSVKTNAKCYTLESFSKQYELDEESRRSLLEAAGCRL